MENKVISPDDFSAEDLGYYPDDDYSYEEYDNGLILGKYTLNEFYDLLGPDPFELDYFD